MDLPASPSYQIREFPFSADVITRWKESDGRHEDWPVVYLLSNEQSMYVGETLNAARRLREHLETEAKKPLRSVRVVLNDRANKSACLDLESFLIQMFQGDGRFDILNRNIGITDADYFERKVYRKTFDELFSALQARGLFSRNVEEIRNDELFKLSPYKALTAEQTESVKSILRLLSADGTTTSTPIVINGDPGTGKTIIAVYTMKLLADLATSTLDDLTTTDSAFTAYFDEGQRESFRGLRIGLVVPQQALRKSLKRVFTRVDGLNPSMVMTPFDVGSSDDIFDLLIVDEAHRLNQRANQAAGYLNTQFADINKKLFGSDDVTKTQLDWVRAMSKQQVLLLDANQSVRTADLDQETIKAVRNESRIEGRELFLRSQMRVRGGEAYVDFVGKLLRGDSLDPLSIGDYDFRIFDDISEMRAQIEHNDARWGLSRMVAGYAWPWETRRKRRETRTVIPEYDIRIGREQFSWNSTEVDWVTSENALSEMGSIHAVQGYDLNYAGVVIGEDLRFNSRQRRFRFDRSHYFDKKGMENNRKRGRIYTDDDILRYVQNIYRVLMTRGIRGTYLYVCDPTLREYMHEVYEQYIQQ